MCVRLPKTPYASILSKTKKNIILDLSQKRDATSIDDWSIGQPNIFRMRGIVDTVRIPQIIRSVCMCYLIINIKFDNKIRFNNINKNQNIFRNKDNNLIIKSRFKKIYKNVEIYYLINTYIRSLLFKIPSKVNILIHASKCIWEI